MIRRLGLRTGNQKKSVVQGGFTLVELLIVIVVIAILAAITIISYNGITEKARTTALVSTLSQNVTLLSAYNAENGVYPSDQTAAGLKSSSDITLTYTFSDGNYCLQAQGSSTTYKVTNDDTTPTEGACSGGVTLPAAVAAYNFNENTGGTVHDVTGNGNDMSIPGWNSSDWTSDGHTGSAVNGQNGNSGADNWSFPSPTTNAITMMGWVKPIDASPDASILFGFYEGSSSEFAVYNYRIDYGVHNVLQVDTRVDGTLEPLNYSSMLPQNTWTHVAATYDGSTVSLYLNGSLAQTLSASGTLTQETGFVVGNDVGAYVDDVRVYDQALSQAQIALAMNTPVN